MRFGAQGDADLSRFVATNGSLRESMLEYLQMMAIQNIPSRAVQASSEWMETDRCSGAGSMDPCLSHSILGLEQSQMALHGAL